MTNLQIWCLWTSQYSHHVCFYLASTSVAWLWNSN